MAKKFDLNKQYKFSEEAFKIDSPNYFNMTWWKGLDGTSVEPISENVGRLKRTSRHYAMIISPVWCEEV